MDLFSNRGRFFRGRFFRGPFFRIRNNTTDKSEMHMRRATVINVAINIKQVFMIINELNHSMPEIKRSDQTPSVK